jgi:hypothetical protein
MIPPKNPLSFSPDRAPGVKVPVEVTGWLNAKLVFVVPGWFAVANSGTKLPVRLTPF